METRLDKLKNSYNLNYNYLIEALKSRNYNIVNELNPKRFNADVKRYLNILKTLKKELKQFQVNYKPERIEEEKMESKTVRWYGERGYHYRKTAELLGVHEKIVLEIYNRYGY